MRAYAYIFQKHPDVHKIALSIKSRFPPEKKSINFEDFILNCTVFLHFGVFFLGGGTKFCGREFYAHPDFSEYCNPHVVHIICLHSISLPVVPIASCIASPLIAALLGPSR